MKEYKNTFLLFLHTDMLIDSLSLFQLLFWSWWSVLKKLTVFSNYSVHTTLYKLVIRHLYAF